MSTVAVVAAIIAVVVLAALAVVQVLVAAGRPYGRLVWGGQHEVLPTRLRIGSAISIVLYAGFAWVLLARAGVIPGRSTFVDITTWVLFAYFVVGTAMNAISRSRAERLAATPAAAVLAVCTLLIALS